MRYRRRAHILHFGVKRAGNRWHVQPFAQQDGCKNTAGHFDLDALNAVAELPTILIKARIAQDLRQKDLAEQLGLKDQQIQRYEATDYATASLTRIKEVANALGGEEYQSPQTTGSR